MDADRFDALSRFLTRRMSRHRVLGTAAILGFCIAVASKGRTRARKPDEHCRYVYYSTEGMRFRGYGYAEFPSPCVQCETSRDCESNAFPYCLRDYISLVSGARYDFTR